MLDELNMNGYIIKVVGKDLFVKPEGTYTKNKSEAFTTDDCAKILKNVHALNLAHINDRNPISFEVVCK